jgi:hypothetical protein
MNVWFEKLMLLSCSSFSMRKRKKPYNIFQPGSAVFMILALLWLTVSTPFVYASEQKQAVQNKTFNTQSSPIDANEEDCTNPFGNTTEEKNPNSGNSFSEEYLHDQHIHDHFFSIDAQNYKCEDADTYTAFHGEVQVPPPNVA